MPSLSDFTTCSQIFCLNIASQRHKSLKSTTNELHNAKVTEYDMAALMEATGIATVRASRMSIAIHVVEATPTLTLSESHLRRGLRIDRIWHLL